MSKRSIELLLQECLAAYEAGLSPEDCLLPFARERAELEPLLRQALSLRIAMAAAPSENFRERTKQKLLFVAGKDATKVFNAVEPDEGYVANARSRFLYRAGTSMQEALRDVPPPRLPFWVNARRRLLEASSTRPVRRAPALALRPVLTGAMAVLIAAITSLAVLTSQGGPRTVDAEFASLQDRLVEVEAQAAAGQPPSPAVLIELTRKTNELAQKLSTDQLPQPIVDKLPELIERQRDVLAASETTTPPELQQAQAQLNQAEQVVRLAAARVDTTPAPATGSSTQDATPTAVAPTPTATPKPAVAGPTGTVAPLKAGQVRLTPLPSDTTFGAAWSKVETVDLSLVISASWHVNGINGTSGTFEMTSNLITIIGPDVTVVVNSKTGEINALVGTNRLALRGEGANGAIISVDDLVAKGGSVVLELRHMLETLVHNLVATPTPNVPQAASPTPTATP